MTAPTPATSMSFDDDGDGPLWPLVERLGLPWATRAAQRVVLPALMRELRGSDSGGGTSPSAAPDSVDLSLSVAALPVTFNLTAAGAWTWYLPLAALLAGAAAKRASAHGVRRTLVGFAGSAASGKSTLTMVLCAVGNAWHRVMLATAAAGGEAAGGGSAYTAAFPPPPSPASGGGSDGGSDLFAALSMDAYHCTNAALAGRGLSAVKGRVDTIDAAAFAADLARVRDGAGATLHLPAYDRLVTHDPVPCGVTVQPCHRVVLVEGLYLCSGYAHAEGDGDGSSGDCATSPQPAAAAGGAAAPPLVTTTPPPPPSAHPDPAWADVRACLDVAVQLDTPLALCRARAILRKAAKRMTLEASAAHFDTVDAPVWASLQAGKGRPASGVLAGLLLPVHSALQLLQPPSPRAVTVGAHGAGPDLVLTISAAPASTDSSPASSSSGGGGGGGGSGPHVVTTGDVLTGATLRCAPWAPSAALAATAPRSSTANGGSSSSSSVLVLGLNPCVQRSLVFKGAGAAVKDAAAGATTAPSAWRRGDVNRASVAYVTCGGKGQHTAIALARAAAAETPYSVTPHNPPPPPLTVRLAHFLGGANGAQAGEFLERSFAEAIGGGAVSAPAATLQQLTVRLRPLDQPTRTCTTLLDGVAGDMTELIEPPAAVDAAQTCELMESVAAALAPPPAAVALMGTVPPGCEGVYEAVSARVAAGAATTAGGAAPPPPPPLVLMDAVKGSLPALAAGGVHVLKVNADELAILFREAAGDPVYAAAVGAVTAALPLPGAPTAPGYRGATVLTHAAALLHALYCPGGGGLSAVAVTDGPDTAHLVQRRRDDDDDDDASSSTPRRPAPRRQLLSLAHTAYALPPLPAPVVNPIGAGDTTAGVALYHAAVAGRPLPAAFAAGLAAGSASCLSVRGAEFDAQRAAALLAGIAATTAEVALWL